MKLCAQFEVTIEDVFIYEHLLRERVTLVESMINDRFEKVKDIIRAEKKKVRDAKIEESKKEDAELAREKIQSNANKTYEEEINFNKYDRKLKIKALIEYQELLIEETMEGSK